MNQTLQTLRDEFARSAELRRDDERERRRVFGEMQRRKEMDEADDQRRQDEEMDTLIQVALATQTQIADFTVKLDTYDTATVSALMENGEELELAREELRGLLKKAHVLPDGRRVFKTEDGSKVFDETGAEMREVDPAKIDNARPSWERYSSGRNAVKTLETERRELVEYQDKLDNARDRLSDKGLTAKELKDLEKTLDAQMPERVRKHVGADQEAAPTQAPAAPAAVQPERAAFRPGVNLDMPAL